MALTLSARQLADIIKDYYLIDGNNAGGNCHIVLDDNNLSDSAVKFCLEECIKKNDYLGRFIMFQFFLLRKTARGKAIALSRMESK